MVRGYSSVPEQQLQQEQENNDDDSETSPNSDDGCRCFPCFNWRRNTRHHRQGLQENQETWAVQKLMKLREASELMAGPKWKNLIRKMSKYSKNSKKPSKCQPQYDLDSYELNFDREEEDGMLLDFSSRFARPAPALSSDHRNTTAGF